MIITKARSIRIYSGLPADLWPEIVTIATYILNRIPIPRFNGKTPFEILYRKKPSLLHLYIYSCRAYPLRYNIPRLNKIEPRALIGYLVGWDSRNIYRIWILIKKRIYRYRDITFDDNKQYDLSELDLAYILYENKLYKLINITKY